MSDDLVEMLKRSLRDSMEHAVEALVGSLKIPTDNNTRSISGAPSPSLWTDSP